MGETPLFEAVKLSSNMEKDYCEIVRLLIVAGADPRIRTNSKWGPLDEAIAQVINQIKKKRF